MKILLFGTLLFFAVLSSGQAIISHDTVHQEGAAASVPISQDGGFTSLSISRGTDPKGNPQTFLFYDTFLNTPDGFVETVASGLIPNDAFQGDSAAHLRLNVDTSQVTTFSTTTCTLTFFPQFTDNCVPGALGVIQLDWAQSRSSVTHSVTTQSESFNLARIELHQTSDQVSAVVTGSFLGIPVNTSGPAMVNHSSSMEVFRFQ
jgi:hypothetical protein